MKDDIIKQFVNHASNASYHFADDSTKEWQDGYREQQKALEIFDAHPELEQELRQACKEQIWSLNQYRPTNDQ